MKVHGLKRLHGEKMINRTPKIWFCDGCDGAFTWDRQSCMYGSEKDIEAWDFHLVWIACGEQCKEAMPAGFPKGVRRPKMSMVVSYAEKLKSACNQVST